VLFYVSSFAGKNSNTDKPVSMKRSHGLHFRDNILDNWSNLGIKLVKFAFYDTGKEVAYVIFNGVDSNIHNWFDRKRVIQAGQT
jgi:ATP/ADP translocase